MIKAEEKDINIREYSEMVDRLVEHYLGAIETQILRFLSWKSMCMACQPMK